MRFNKKIRRSTYHFNSYKVVDASDRDLEASNNPFATVIQSGIEQGASEKEHEKNLLFTRNLLLSTDLSLSKIAKLVGVNEGFVKNVKENL